MDAAFEQARECFVAGTRALDEGRPGDAERHLLASLALLPGRVSTLVNLGVARLRLGRPDDALRTFDEALAADPAAIDGHAHRGVALAALGRHAEALQCFDRVLAVAGDDADATYHRGLALGMLGRPEDALAAFERLTVLQPGRGEAWFRRGQALQVIGRPAAAVDAYRQAVVLEPGHAQAWSQLGGLLNELGQSAAAKHAFQRALALGADPAVHGWFLAALGDRPAPPSAPRAYVERLFDGYATAFDHHLVDRLRYRAPAALAALLAEDGHAPCDAALDLGCGTGLLGPVLRPLARRLDGVDLSRGMLERARETGAYDTLLHADATTFLQSTDRRYGVVAAADVFIYIGDLDPVFAGVRRVLEARGRFVFSAERAADELDVTLHHGLRYAHGERHLHALASRHGFEVLRTRDAPLREEQGRPVAGLFMLLAPV